MGGFHHMFGGLTGLAHLVRTDPIPLAARLTLAAVLATAGLYKLRHPLIAASAAVNFRVIRHPWRIAGTALGLAETFVAALLVIPVHMAALVGCVAAGVLSAGYVAVTAKALGAAERFPCQCLPGLVGDVSPATLARAIAMVIAAGIGCLGPASGDDVAAHSILPAVGLAVACLGLPLAAAAANGAWRSYRLVMADVDWEWVLAVRGGYAALPTPRNPEGSSEEP